MKNINPNLMPREGYTFRDKDGTKHTGTSWPNLARRVREYRTRLNLDPGNIEQEISDQICSRQPGICRSSGRTEKPVAGVALKTRLLKWLAEQFKQKIEGAEPKYVSMEEKNARVNACLKCPLSRMVSLAGCSCKKNVEEYRKVLLGPKQPVDMRLSSCELYGFDLPTAVWFDTDRVERPDAPDFCWKKALANPVK